MYTTACVLCVYPYVSILVVPLCASVLLSHTLSLTFSLSLPPPPPPLSSPISAQADSLLREKERPDTVQVRLRQLTRDTREEDSSRLNLRARAFLLFHCQAHALNSFLPELGGLLA